MLPLLQRALLCIYAGVPIIAAGLLLARWHRTRAKAALKAVISTAAAAMILSFTMSMIFALATASRPRFDQIALGTLYFAAILTLLKLAAHGIERGAHRLARNRSDRAKRILATTLQLVFFLVIGLPWIMAAVMTWRPKVAISGDPRSLYNWPFTLVTFRATDNTPISAYWIPAPAAPPAAPADWGRRTVLVCHGLGANKLNQLHMARLFHPTGWNILAIDLRAHAGSGGQFSTFGAHESRDVLGAVRYLKSEHAIESTKIVGLGASLGAAALITAAGSNTREGKLIDAVIVYGTFSDLRTLADDVAINRFPPPLGTLARHVAVPLAGVHAGVSLTSFRPVESIARIAPRPVLIIHGVDDRMIPIAHAERLFNAAREPKELIRIPGDHNDIIENESAARRALEFTLRVRD